MIKLKNLGCLRFYQSNRTGVPFDSPTSIQHLSGCHQFPNQAEELLLAVYHTA